MKKINVTHSFLVLFVVFLSSCSINKTYETTLDMPDVNVQKENKGNEIVFNDEAFEKQIEQTATSGQGNKGTVQTTKDGSEISIMQDGYGNTVETRNFYNHPNLTVVTIKTFANGEKEGLAYGHNGERKKLSPDAISIALSAGGNEIASSVGINSTKIQSTGKTVMPITNQDQVYSKPEPVYVQPQPIQNTTENQGETVNNNEQLPIPNPTPKKEQINLGNPQITKSNSTKNKNNQ